MITQHQLHHASIITRIRNRNAVLEASIHNWLNTDVSEVIIVDYRDEGCESTWDVLANISDSRIKLLETKHEYLFLPTFAWNLGISQVRTPYLILMDVDNEFRDNFFDTHTLEENCFLTGRKYPHLTGFLYTEKQYVEAVGGFNENLVYMGYEDIDLFCRLQQAGYTPKGIDRNTLHHRDHPRHWTVCNQITPIGEKQLLDKGGQVREAMNTLNHTLCRLLPWNAQSAKTRWTITQIEDRRYSAVRNVLSNTTDPVFSH